jgi:copper oxidase (laccase) domain-containing protein
MIKSMGCSPEDLIVGIGPGIQLCHFEIQTDILENFSNYQESIVNRNNHIFVDLPKIIMRQLDEAGVPEKNIESSGVCTFCQKDQYFSYRRDKPKEVEAMIAYIGIA